jgi:predicted secreted hydrolase
MRRLLLILAAAVSISAAAAAAADVAPVQLPRDHYAHPGSGIEWWYFTVLVRDPAGTRYSVFFTDFSSNGFVVPVAQVRNLDTGKLVGHLESLAPAHLGTTSLDLAAGGTKLQYLAASNAWNVSVAGKGWQVSLSQKPEKPYALHGGGSGVIRQSVAGISHYYSATRMRATGTLRAGGKTLALTGQSWFDHQWGDYAGNPRAFNWDWFSCRFDDNSELMGYQFLDRATGKPLPGLANGTFVAANGKATAVNGFVATHNGRSFSGAGHTWPLDWQLRASTPKLAESVTSLLPDQLVRNTIVPTFWEGAANANGTHSGPCFVEISYR